MRHTNQAKLLTNLRFTFPDFAEPGHIRHLPGKTRRAGLSAGIGVNLGIQYQYLDRHFRHQYPGKVLETDIVHCTITPYRDDRRTQTPFFFAELLPVKIGKKLIMLLRVKLTCEHQLSLSDRFEAIGHTDHMALKNTHRHRWRVLEKVICPGKGIRVVRISGTPYRRTAGRVNDTHSGSATPGLAFCI